MRPKCTIVDEDGRLAIGKFPSVNDTRSVTRGEVLALKLAQLAGIDAAPARIVSPPMSPWPSFGDLTETTTMAEFLPIGSIAATGLARRGA